MRNTNAGVPHVNNLTMADRVKLVDWLRSERDTIPTKTSAELVEAAIEHLGRSCSAQQLRDTSKAANVPWNPKSAPRTGGGAAGSNRYRRLEARVKYLEGWCVSISESLGIDKPEFPSDEDLQE